MNAPTTPFLKASLVGNYVEVSQGLYAPLQRRQVHTVEYLEALVADLEASGITDSRARDELEGKLAYQRLREAGIDPRRSRRLLNYDREKAARRAKLVAANLIRCNAQRYYDPNGYVIPTKLLTLTTGENIQDIRIANKLFTPYARALDAVFGHELAGGNLAYASFPEFQKRGAVHYHVVLFNFPFVRDRVYTKLRSKWPHGRLYLSPGSNKWGLERLISYCTKYVTKSMEDKRFFARKRYFASKRLIRPKVVREPRLIAILEQELADTFVGAREWRTDFATGVTRRYLMPDRHSIDTYLREVNPGLILVPEHQQQLFGVTIKGGTPLASSIASPEDE